MTNQYNVANVAKKICMKMAALKMAYQLKMKILMKAAYENNENKWRKRISISYYINES